MPNANENMAPVSYGDAATEPIDLAQAFKMYNQANREAAQESLEDPEDQSGLGSGEIDEQGSTDESGSSMAEGGSDSATASSGQEGDGDDLGGSSDGVAAIDFNAYKQRMLRDIQSNAAQQVRKEFNDENIGYYSISELRVSDEQTGKVRYRNPDVQDERDPDYYFRTRTDAQNFCDAWNKGVDFEFRKAVNQKQQDLLNQAAPTARLIDFLPKWQAMDPATREVFDDLLEGHEIRDANGKEIGFNVNLDAVAAQAFKIANRFKPAAQAQSNEEQPQQKQGSGPALDMKTGNGKSEDDAEPTNIGEALKMLDKKNRGK